MTSVTALESRPDSGNQNHILNLIGAVQQTGTDNAFAATPDTVRANSGENTTDIKINDYREGIHGTEDVSNPTNNQEEGDARSGHGPIRTGSEHGSLEQQPGSHEAITGSIDENNNLVGIFSSFENARENGGTRLFQNRGSTRSARNAQVDIWLQETFDAGQNTSFREYIAEEAELADVCSSSSDEGEPTLCDFELFREVTREYEITEERAQIMDDLEDSLDHHGREEPQQMQDVDETRFESDEPIEFEGLSRFFRKLTISRLKRKVVEWVRKVRAATKSSGEMFQPDVYVETALRRTFPASFPEADERLHVFQRRATDLRIRVLRENFIQHVEELARETSGLANETQSVQEDDVREVSFRVQVSSVVEPEISVEAVVPEISIQAAAPEISVQEAVNAAEPEIPVNVAESESSIQELESEFKQNYVTWIEGFSGFRRTTRKRRTRKRRSSRNETSVSQRVRFESLPESSQPLTNGSSDPERSEEVFSRPVLAAVANEEVPIVESSSIMGLSYVQQIFDSLDEFSHVEEGSIDSEDYDT